MSATEFEGMPDPRWKELYALRTQTRQQAERIQELERLVTSQGISSMEDLDENQQLRAALVSVREALQFANDTPNGPIQDTIWMMHRQETLFDFIDALLPGQPVEDKGETNE